MADVTSREVEPALYLEMGFGFNFLRQKLAQHHLLGEVLGSDDGMIGPRRSAAGQEECGGASHRQQCGSAEAGRHFA